MHGTALSFSGLLPDLSSSGPFPNKEGGRREDQRDGGTGFGVGPVGTMLARDDGIGIGFSVAGDPDGRGGDGAAFGTAYVRLLVVV